MDSTIKEVQTLFTKIDPNPQNQSDLYLMRSLRAIRDLKRSLSPNLKNDELHILDIGCGCGYNTCLLHELGDVVAGDTELKRFKTKWTTVNRELRNLRIQFTSCDGLALPFKGDIFSLVVSFGVLEHISECAASARARTEKPELDEELFLKEIFRVLKAGGVFLICYLPNKTSYIEPLAKLLGKYYHRRKFTEKGIEELCFKVGFEIVRINRRNFLFAQYHLLGRNIGNLLNKFTFLLNRIDEICLHTPLSLFANDFYIIAQKPLVEGFLTENYEAKSIF